jgi:DNA mismatch repair protein MSH5
MENPSTIPMSVVEHGRHIAFAAYNQLENQIILENCVVSIDFGPNEIAERVVAAVRPTLLLLSTKICGDASLLEALSTPPFTPSEGIDTNEDVPTAGSFVPVSIPYRLLKSSSFDVRTCKAIILKLRVATIVQSSGHTGGGPFNQPQRQFPVHDDQHFKVSTFHSLASIIDFECTAEVQALGSLLSFIQMTTLRPENGSNICVHDVVRAHTSMHMAISVDTFSALHIFATERHPLVASKGSGNSKEGFSLFSFLDRTRSRAGRAQLREWMLKPLTDVAAITARQDGIEAFMLPDMQTVTGNIFKLMERIGTVDKILVRIQKCSCKYLDFLALAKSLSSATAIVDTIQEEVIWKLRQRCVPLCSDDIRVPNASSDERSNIDVGVESYMNFIVQLLQRCNVTTLQSLFERITSVIDEEATFERKAIVIQPGHNIQLDKFKQEFDRLEETLSAAGERLVQRMPHLCELVKVIFLPQVGFLVAVQDQIDWSEIGVLTDDFAFVFTEAGKSFFKNDDVRELDEDIGDLDAYIKDIEALILTDLEDDILDCEKELRCTFSTLAELDCILALAECALDHKYVRPEIAPMAENCIHIFNGRHPLQEIVMDSAFVPNSTNIDASDRVNIITGPNFSGKSCYARQVGILTFMSHIGSFIPCDAARISVVDQILARFSSVETCAVPQSSFQLDLSQMGTILRRATPNTLVIIDEFGKGTSPASGIALLTAALQRFSNVHCKVLCTTHFLEIFSMGLVKDGDNGIKALRMSVRIPKTSEESAMPLFTLEEGVSSSSAGLVCAKMAGVKEAVIARAREIVEAVKGRRKVKPLVEILRGQLDMSDIAKEALDEFIRSNWKDAGKEEINRFLSKVVMM